MSTTQQQYLTQQEAADLAEKSVYTIKRHRKKGAFPGARQRHDGLGTWEIPYDDLVTAGLVDAGAQTAEQVTEHVGLARTTRRVVELTERLQAAERDAKRSREETQRLTRLVEATQKEKDQLYRLLLSMQEVA